jgi:hypothetical protein
MAYQAPILSQIIQEVNRCDFKKQVSKYNSDYKVSKLNCFGLLVTMIYAQLKTNRTLRDIVIGFQAALSGFYHLGLKTLKRSTISDALRDRAEGIYRDFYYSLLSLFVFIKPFGEQKPKKSCLPPRDARGTPYDGQKKRVVV